MQINRNNYESFFLLHLDGELNPQEILAVEKFMLENADLRKEFDLLKQTVLIPEDIVFEQKESLLKKDEKRRVIPIFWLRMAAAISVLILGSWFVISQISQRRSDLPVAAIPVIAESGGTKVSQESRNTKASENKIAETIVPGSGENMVPLTNKQKSDIHALTSNRSAKAAAITVKQTPDLIEEDPVVQQKSAAALELQSIAAGSRNKSAELAMVSSLAPGVLIAVPAIENQPSGGTAKETASVYQNENAISVVALNDKNKGITGFFNKLTKRAPVDENERKLRVSVFQISY